MSQLPAGTVTFVFTDIESSTRLWERHRDAMALDLELHDELVRRALEDRGGFVFKTVGDEFCAAFSTPGRAIEAAIDAQRALAGATWKAPEPVRVRMAVLTGVVEERGGDYFGPPLNRCARLLGAGHGGQVLVAETSADLIGSLLPENAALVDLGTHRLKDLGAPCRVWQLAAPGLAADFPPLVTLDAHQHNLPIQMTSFVGRSRELDEVVGLLGATRLLTLTGVGGAGKSRLALQSVAVSLDDYPDGAWLAELAPISEAALVPTTIAKALGLPEEPGRPILETIASHVTPKRTVLVLDNCEHVRDECSAVVYHLLRSAPQLSVLATSREPLAVDGETTWSVPPLTVASPSRGEAGDRHGGPAQHSGAVATSVADVAAYSQGPALGAPESVAGAPHELGDAERLFVERARAVQPSFELSSANTRAVSEICRRLDGIPLAIELAAARVRLLSPPELSARLGDRFALLTRGSRTGLPRHQTLKRAMDWSYDLLNEREQALFRRLAVFRGGWSLDAAEAVCAFPPVPAPEVLDLLSSLVDKSLVVVTERDGRTRQRFLRSVQQYAAELGGADDERGAARDAHLDHFVSFAVAADEGLAGPEQVSWLERLELDHDNLRAALDYGLSCGPGDERVFRLVGALGRFWHMHGYLTEGTGYLEGALAQGADDAAPPLRARALTWAGNMAYQRADFPAARVHHEASLAVQRELGDDRGTASALGNLGLVAYRTGDCDEALDYFTQTLAIMRELDNDAGVALTMNNIGLICLDRYDFATAADCFTEGLAIWRSLGNTAAVALMLGNLGLAEAGLGDHDGAKRHHTESLSLLKQLEDPVTVAGELEALAHLAVEEDDHAVAARLAGAADGLRGKVDAPLPGNERTAHQRDLTSIKDALGDEALIIGVAEGRAMAMDEAIAYALEWLDSG